MNKTAVVCPQGADSLNDVIFSRGVCVRITRGCFLKNSYITNFTPEDGGFLSGMGLEYNILFFESSLCYSGFPGGSAGEESTCNAGALGSIPGLGRSPGGGRGNPLWYSRLENPHGQRNLAGYSSWNSRILEWVALPFSRESSQPRDRTQGSHIVGGFFTS